MFSFKTIFTLIGVAVLVVVTFFSYRFFLNRSRDDGLPALVPSGGGASASAAARTDEFLEILLSLRQIDLRGDFLADPVFKNLTDFSRELQPQTPGRENPFAPIGQGGPPPLPTSPSVPATTTPPTSPTGGPEQFLRLLSP